MKARQPASIGDETLGPEQDDFWKEVIRKEG
jgi:hypothetical protein